MAADDKPGLGRETSFDCVQNFLGALGRNRDLGLYDLNPGLNRSVVQTVQDRAVFLIRCQYLVSCFPPKPVDDDIYGRRYIRQERQILWRQV